MIILSSSKDVSSQNFCILPSKTRAKGGGRGVGEAISAKTTFRSVFVLNLISYIIFFLNIRFLDLSHSNEDSVMNLEFKIGLLVKNYSKLTKR